MSLTLTLPVHPTRRHPLTGEPLKALAAHSRTGRLVWPIMGGDDTVPPAVDPPEGVTEQEWATLGDAGKQAIGRERERANAAERALAASRARPVASRARPVAPLKPAEPAESKSGEQPDIAAIVQQAVAAAIKPFTDREDQRSTMEEAGKIQDAVLTAAKDRLHDATDALAGIDLTTVVNEQGKADAEKVTKALDDLISRKPHLAKSTERIAPPGIGGGGPANATEAEKVKAALADMQRATGVRLPSSTS